MKSKRYLTRRGLPKRNALVVALALGMGVSGLAYGQATTGLIFGTAPQQSGETVQVRSSSGIMRTTAVTDGSYSISNLPVGKYTVTLMQNGSAVSSKTVTVRVGSGTQTNFASGASASNAQNLGGVSVTANALPSIDVSQTSTSTTLTAAQLKTLPIGQSADSIALLSPGVTAGSNYFGGVSFGGAGITENAYYVNGYNTTGLYNSEGPAYNLPYGAISQQQVLTHGYSAKYGRADGGIINQIGKSGTDEWHFGARIQWVPRSLRQSPKVRYYQHVPLKAGETGYGDNVHGGQLDQDRSKNKGWDTLYSAYVGGPLVKDKLYIFAAADVDMQSNRNVSSVAAAQDSRYKNHESNYYFKANWNINDSNVFEYTFLKDQYSGSYGTAYDYDNETETDVGVRGPLAYTAHNYRSDIFHYTSYIGDNGTLSVIYGRSRQQNPYTNPSAVDLPYIAGLTGQDPALNGGTPINNNQTNTSTPAPVSEYKSHGLRADFSYQLDNHLLSAGIDNMYFQAKGVGQDTSGPGYLWIYAKQSDPSRPISPTQDVGAPGGNGYFVEKYIYRTIASMSARQKAYYIQDQWQITPNVLVNIGVRNDRFDNYNNLGQPFITEKNQWEPRFGVSWDVYGDGSFKLYANAGRYYLALPQAVANRQATASTYTRQYYTYSGIDSNGIPTGLTPVPTVEGDPAGPGPVSANGEFGIPPDPKKVASTNIKPQYQDEFMVGFDKKLNDSFTYGASAVYRKLGTLIDDGCYEDAINEAITKSGHDPANYDVSDNNCHLFNPGRTNTFFIPGKNGAPDLANLPVTNEETGLPKPQREYYALNLYMEHPFDGTWFGRIDYTFSRSWGNSEGQVRSDIGQGDIAATEDWDYRELMVGSRGYLANNVRHQLKAYGAWQITPEWMLSGNLSIQSGRPVSCLGFYGPDHTNPGGAYGSDYHWCDGKISTPGATTTPWTKQLNLGVTYRPSFADNKLALKMYVFNVLGEQKPLQLQPHRFQRSARSVLHTYHQPLFYETPRYVRFTISYDY